MDKNNSQNKKKSFAGAVRNSSKYVTMFALVLALGVAVYLNWRFSEIEANETLNDNNNQQQGSEGENYGDALFVSGDGVNTSSYFAQARLSRTESRDSALDSLQKALQNTELTEAEKTELTAKLTAVAQSITAESNIESMIKAKGFSDCMAYISDGAIKVIVACSDGELTGDKTAQIVEIVTSQTDIPAQKISIVEVKT